MLRFLCIPLSKQRHIGDLLEFSTPCKRVDIQLSAETKAEYSNRKLDFMWLAKHCSALGCIQEVRITRWSSG